ncbi:MAG: hypothetical protein OXB84_08290 [Halobacteriovoraceae bacterium]|nr:hypothetical protein [Halobacteriovoraceae bacterium]
MNTSLELKEKTIFKIRTIGIKDGKKEFSIPLKKEINLSFNNQQYDTNNTSLINRNTPDEKSEEEKIFSTFYKREENKRIKENMLRRFSSQEDMAVILKNTSLDLKFEPPEGVKEDELNTIEKIFYSFQRRMIINYYYSLFSSYNKLMLSNPRLKDSLLKSNQHLIGKIIFDHKGNTIRIKTIKWSSDDHIQELFEDTLRGIQSVPNPPRNFVEDNDEFTVYYHLIINSNG